jgi:hypothetical protein
MSAWGCRKVRWRLGNPSPEGAPEGGKEAAAGRPFFWHLAFFGGWVNYLILSLPLALDEVQGNSQHTTSNF